jgi:hypothetical protein
VPRLARHGLQERTHARQSNRGSACSRPTGHSLRRIGDDRLKPRYECAAGGYRRSDVIPFALLHFARTGSQCFRVSGEARTPVQSIDHIAGRPCLSLIDVTMRFREARLLPFELLLPPTCFSTRLVSGSWLVAFVHLVRVPGGEQRGRTTPNILATSDRMNERRKLYWSFWMDSPPRAPARAAPATGRGRPRAGGASASHPASSPPP